MNGEEGVLGFQGDFVGLLVYDANQELDCVERECFIFSVFSLFFFFLGLGYSVELAKVQGLAVFVAGAGKSKHARIDVTGMFSKR
jgi:hypothetical protein